MPTPQPISNFLSYKQLGEAEKWQPKPKEMAKMQIDENYIAISQDGNWNKHTKEKQNQLKKDKGIRILRDYQVQGVKALQLAYCKENKRRFLFEMATGTGKTLLCAAIIKLFLRSECAKKVLFLVDRIELENQAKSSFDEYLKNDGIKTVIYKENKDKWQNANIVVTTIQSLAIDSRYRKIFSPADFQLIISDEAHRTINGNNRAIFEYFIGAKLGLTATPKNYLKGIDVAELSKNNQKQLEERQMKDTYKTFGCEEGKPTFTFDLLAGVKAGVLCNPFVIDARTDITTSMLSDEGLTLVYDDENGEEQADIYHKKDYGRKFTSDETDKTFVKIFLENAKRDPMTEEIGKTIMFAVSRRHATRLTQLLNEEIEYLYPNHYKNTFAKQITSDLPDAHENTPKFSHNKNNLEGKTQFCELLPEYNSSRTRVCVTVAMMTTGYDCQDLLNVVLCRPVMSPTEFVQIKGRGTRLFTFEYTKNAKGTKESKPIQKDNYYLIDFFGNYEYFEHGFNYNKKIELPKPNGAGDGTVRPTTNPLDYTGNDNLAQLSEIFITEKGMKIDREMFATSASFEEKVKTDVIQNITLKKALEEENWAVLSAHIQNEIFEKPKEFWNIDKLCDAYEIDRRLSMQEILLKTFGKIDKFKTRTELADDAFATFLTTIKDEKIRNQYQELRNLFHCYLLYSDIREKIQDNKFADFETDNRLSFQQLKTLGKENIHLVKNYILDNITLNPFYNRS